MGIARITALLAVTALLLALPAMVLAQAQPPRPPVFGGTVTTDGVVASDGTLVTAWIDGNRVASAMVSGGGYAFAIPQPPGGSYAGKTITFKIGDTTASETGIWQSDGGGQLNLTSASEYTDVVRVGFFGTVSAIPAGTFILDGGEIVAIDENT